MYTTALRLPDELKARIAKLAEKSGKTAHSVMLDAIAQKVEEEELRASSHGEADARFAEMIESGVGIPSTQDDGTTSIGLGLSFRSGIEWHGKGRSSWRSQGWNGVTVQAST